MDIYSVEYSCEKGYCLDCIEIEKNRKKTTEHVRAAIVIIAMVFSMLIIIFDSKNVQAQEIEEVKSLWYIKKDYPLTMNDTSWNEYSLLESIEILNPPEDLLNEMTSEELAQLLLKYPYMWILSTYEYNHIDYYYDFLETNSDIYQELIKREDGIVCILNEYRESNFDISVGDYSPYIVWENNQNVNAEIFACHFITEKMDIFSNEELLLAEQIMIEKEKIYSGSTNKLLSLYLSFNNEVDWIHNESFANDNNLYSLSLGFEAVAAPITRIIESNNIMFTPGTYHKYGIRTSCYKWYSNMYDNNTIAALDSSIAFQWTKLYSATPKFNCHSYAWISSNYNNQFWLDSPSAYMFSSDITYVGYNVTPQNGDIVVMYNRSSGAISHSAVICSAPSGGSGIYTKSKIGGLGVYMAPLSELKMYYNCDNYDVYRIN